MTQEQLKERKLVLLVQEEDTSSQKDNIFLEIYVNKKPSDEGFLSGKIYTFHF